MFRFRPCALLIGSLLLVSVGCGEKDKVELRYDHPAQYEIPANIRTLGIARFEGKTSMDKRWGDIASDRLAARLDTYNNKYHRYQLVDRKRLKALLDEQDLQSAFNDSAQAVQAGKIAKVDAMIYGTVTVTSRDDRGRRSKFNPISGKTREVSYTRRHVMTAVNFTIDNVTTGKTLASVSLTRDYDSDNSKGSKGSGNALSGVMGAVGLGGSSGEPEPTEQVASRLIDECVEEFLTRVSPHEVVVTEVLGKGSSEAVKTGNKLAVAGDYAEAIEAYQAGLKQKPGDHEAMFNTGVMYEAMGKLTDAEQWYSRAFKMKAETQYIKARKRVRLEKVNGN